jgi:hypothetical protein
MLPMLIDAVIAFADMMENDTETQNNLQINASQNYIPPEVNLKYQAVCTHYNNLSEIHQKIAHEVNQLNRFNTIKTNLYYIRFFRVHLA